MSDIQAILNRVHIHRREQDVRSIPQFSDPFADFDSLMKSASQLGRNDREMLFFLVDYFFRHASQDFVEYYQNATRRNKLGVQS